MKYSNFGYRINTIHSAPGPTWLFLPGGPGLGSAYLIDFCERLVVPGSKVLIDFPKDGTNPEGKLDLLHWQQGLVDLLASFDKPILVTHSFAGQLVMTIPTIETYLSKLVLMNTTTQNSFFEHVAAMQNKHHLPDLIPAASAYHLNPSDATYRAFWDTYKHYCFTANELPQGEAMIKLFAFNHNAYQYAVENFYPTYTCQLQPTSIPVMTIASEHDYICPPTIFTNDVRFQSNNITNHIIPMAGHCPWVAHLPTLQTCFNEFLPLS